MAKDMPEKKKKVAPVYDYRTPHEDPVNPVRIKALKKDGWEFCEGDKDAPELSKTFRRAGVRVMRKRRG